MKSRPPRVRNHHSPGVWSGSLQISPFSSSTCHASASSRAATRRSGPPTPICWHTSMIALRRLTTSDPPAKKPSKSRMATLSRRSAASPWTLGIPSRSSDWPAYVGTDIVHHIGIGLGQPPVPQDILHRCRSRRSGATTERRSSVIGAGATRGASFVEERRLPPPLDLDFFRILQMAETGRTSEGRDLLEFVRRNYGPALHVGMEIVFNNLDSARTFH